jgi:hypothetical protein
MLNVMAIWINCLQRRTYWRGGMRPFGFSAGLLMMRLRQTGSAIGLPDALLDGKELLHEFQCPPATGNRARQACFGSKRGQTPVAAADG